MHRMLWTIGALLVLWTGTARSQCEIYYTLKPEPAQNAIVLAIDCSGSMNGQPFEDAKAGAMRFVEKMRASDVACVMSFSDEVQEVLGMTGNHAALRQAIRRLNVGGATKLYDAIARSILKLIHRDGGRIVVFLTDGRDTGSRYRVEELRKIGVSEGLFVYGIGLGDVDQNALNALSSATGGTFEVAATSSDLRDLYPRVLAEYYRKYGDRLAASGALSLRSLPDGRRVMVNGQRAGTSPVKLDALTPGMYGIQVMSDRGTWECEVPVKAGHRTVVDARASDLGGELVLSSLPPNASVFLDGTYVGTTSIAPLSPSAGELGWVQGALRDARQLRVSRVPYGAHKLRFRAIPDVDFGPQQEFEVEVQVTDSESVLYVEIFATGRSPYALYSGGKAEIIGEDTGDTPEKFDRSIFDDDRFE